MMGSGNFTEKLHRRLLNKMEGKNCFKNRLKHKARKPYKLKNQIMKKLIYMLSITGFLMFACNNQQTEQPLITEEKSQDYTGPIIDMHIHAFHDGNPLFGMTHPPTLRGKTYAGVKDAQEQKEKTLEKFRKHNIVKAVVTSGQLWGDEAGDLILIADADKELDVLRNLYNENKLRVIAEMAPFYSGQLANDPSVMPYFELAQELDIPVGFHVFPGGPNYGFHIMPEMLGGMRVKNANPLQLEDVLVKFPKLKIYIMHGGWPYTEDLKALMYAHPNVYVDIAVLNWILPQEELNSYLKSLINAGFEDRILFGTDQMAWPDTIDDAVASVNNAYFLTLEQKENIFYNNAARFLGLTDEEIKKHKQN
jgi:uncharacterized protein